MPEVGFFTRVDLAAGLAALKGPKRGDTRMSPDRLRQLECKACPLNRIDTDHSKMEPRGAKEPHIYALGGVPGKSEDAENRPMAGDPLKLFRHYLGDKWSGRVRYNNVIRDRIIGTPKHYKKIAPTASSCCAPSIERDIAKTKPRVIFALGAEATNWFGAQGAITLWRGRRFPAKFGDTSVWVYPMYSPAHIVRTAEDRDGKDAANLFRIDMRNALKDLDTLEPPRVWTEEELLDGLILLRGVRGDLERVRTLLKSMRSSERVTFDIEARGKRPYSKDYAVLCISFSDGETTFSVAIDHPASGWSKEDKGKLLDILEDFFFTYKGQLGAQNLSYDLEALTVTYWNDLPFARPYDRWNDTMARAFVLDERQGALRLDLLTLLYLGLRVKTMTQGMDKQRMHLVEITKLLRYNALDSRVTWLVEEGQIKDLKREKLTELYRMHMTRIPCIVNTQRKGTRVEQEAVTVLDNEFEPILMKAHKGLNEDKHVLEYRQHFGPFNPDSATDCIKLFKEIVRAPEGEQEDGRYSTDDKVLSSIRAPVAKLVLTYREFNKLQSTYLRRLRPDQPDTYIYPDGLIHTSLKHTGTVTSRLASDDPNMQNVPIREHPEIRRPFVPPTRGKNRWILAADYGAQEGCVIGAVSQDPRYRKFIFERRDVHMVWAERLVRAYPKVLLRHLKTGQRYKSMKTDKELRAEVMKRFRTAVKNAFTFPEFYLASLYRICIELHIPEQFVRPVHEEFWDFFDGIKGWQNSMLNFYRKHGYVETMTKRRRHGPMSPNMIVNSPIQGVCADITMDAMARCSKKAYDESAEEFQPNLQVHDDLTFDVFGDSKGPNEKLVAEIGKTMLDHRFKWLDVPMKVEFKAGKNWCDMHKVAEFYSDDFFPKRTQAA